MVELAQSYARFEFADLMAGEPLHNLYRMLQKFCGSHPRSFNSFFQQIESLLLYPLSIISIDSPSPSLTLLPAFSCCYCSLSFLLILIWPFYKTNIFSAPFSPTHLHFFSYLTAKLRPRVIQSYLAAADELASAILGHESRMVIDGTTALSFLFRYLDFLTKPNNHRS